MRMIRFLVTMALVTPALFAGVEVDVDAFGQSLGGWKARSGKAADYEISDSGYRTYKPEVTPSPDGGIFVSLRIDLRRGWLASDDHASLEMTFGPDAKLVSAQSSLALQGRAITSDLIRDTAGGAGKVVPVPGAEHAVQMGANMTADLSAKLLREQIVEPGRVTFPAAIRHNYNLLYKVVKLRKEDGTTEKPVTPAAPAPGTPPKTPAKDPAKPEDKTNAGTKLEIKTFDTAQQPAATPPAAPAPAAAPPAK
jgi:hypothetical protein